MIQVPLGKIAGNFAIKAGVTSLISLTSSVLEGPFRNEEWCENLFLTILFFAVAYLLV